MANDVSAEGAGFGSDRSVAVIVSDGSLTDLGVSDKRAVASKLVDAITDLLGAKGVLAPRKGVECMRRWDFTSESVTEGHPDKMADQISDAILDAILEQDPTARVACEALLTTGLVMVAGEITTGAYVEIPEIVRDVVSSIGYTSSEMGFDGLTCGVTVSIGQQSPDIAMGVNNAYEVRQGTSGEDSLFGQGAGDQGMMFGYACDETEDLMPVPIWLAHRLAHRLAQVRKVGVLPYLRPDGKTQVTFEYEDGRPVRLKTVLISTQHRPTVDLETLLKPDLRDHVVTPIVPAEYAGDGYEILTNPTGRFELGAAQRRHRPDRAEDHCRHLRWCRPSRRWCFLGQRPVEGGPFRRPMPPVGWPSTSSLRGRPSAVSCRSPMPSGSPGPCP